MGSMIAGCIASKLEGNCQEVTGHACETQNMLIHACTDDHSTCYEYCHSKMVAHDTDVAGRGIGKKIDV